MRPLNPADFVDLSVFTGDFPLRVDLVYAQKNHPRNIFGEQIYHDNAKCWTHKDVACITLLAAARFFKTHGLIFSVKDSLRTVDAQARMQETEIVKRNPHWCEEPNRLLSPPGMGGHPRGMAIDITLQNAKGDEIDMGTPFDYLSEDPNHNPAARNYMDLPQEILTRRKDMEKALMDAARDLNIPFMPLSSEWWDYRCPSSLFNQFSPLSDSDLPDEMKMVQKPKSSAITDRSQLLDDIRKRLSPHLNPVV